MNKQEFNKYMIQYNKAKRYRFSINLSADKERDIFEAIVKAGDGNLNKGVKKLVKIAIKAS